MEVTISIGFLSLDSLAVVFALSHEVCTRMTGIPFETLLLKHHFGLNMKRQMGGCMKTKQLGQSVRDSLHHVAMMHACIPVCVLSGRVCPLMRGFAKGVGASRGRPRGRVANSSPFTTQEARRATLCAGLS